MKNKNALKISILSISFLLMTRLTISPALAEIGKAFPAESQSSLMNMVILASVFAIPFGLISGYLSNFISKRKLLFIGLILYLIGGIGPIFANSYSVILVLRCVLGAGIGFFIPMTTGFIADFFENEERIKMFGFQNSSVAVGNIITGLLAGILAAISWRFSFLIYVVGIIVFILTFINIPEPVRIPRTSNKKKALNFKVLFICFSMFLYAIVYFSFFGYLSFVIDTHNMGNAATAGIATTMMTAASFLTGFVFPKLTNACKKFNVVVALLINFAGFFILSIASNISIIFLGAIVIGVGFGFLMPTSVMKVTDASDKSETTFSNSLLMTALNIGTAVSPTILLLIGNTFNNTDGKFIYLVCSIGLLAGAMVSLVFALRPEKSKSADVSVS